MPASRAASLVHQFLPTYHPRDAVGNHTLMTHRTLMGVGLGGRVWAEHVHAELLGSGRRYQGYPGLSLRHRGRRRLLHYQASIGTEGLAAFLAARPEPLSIYYHNITPSRYFERYDAFAARLTRIGRDELKLLRPRVRVALAASGFNAAELRAIGYEDVRVMLPYVGPGGKTAPDPEYLRTLRRRPGLELLFVGRVTPHKGHHHLLRMAAALKADGDRPVRMYCVGGGGPSAYMSVLSRMRSRLGLEGTVFFTDSVPQAQLAAHYASADVFICLSEHEGFCVPLLEAMREQLPVVAYDAGAVGETLGGSGVLLGSLDPLLVAEVVHRVATDEALRAGLRERQLTRAAALDAFDRDEVLLRAMADLGGS